MTTTTDTLRGELISFQPLTPDGWGKGWVQAAAERHCVTGKLVGVQPGDTVELAGTWMDTKYGRQFKVRQCTSTVPQTTAGVVAWMTSALPDIGGKRALALVSKFGVAGLWETIETNPRALCVIDGITPARADAIAVAYEEQRADRDAMIALRGWGLTDNQVARCVERWDTPAEVVAVIRANPYELMVCVAGFGFLRADDVAVRAGIALDSPLRIAAALHHTLGEAVTKGHCYLPMGQLRAQTERLLGVGEQLVAAAMGVEFRAARMVVRGPRVYAPLLEAAETVCADKLELLLKLQGAAA
jgi:exodeoxyribonuclease V alpha subunit